ncbi:hypothetical protein [Bradyrhizobium sp. USDA 3458]|uniref:hypothetical protein n=1 Tax=Bradyrhizobium sp. USDA 3458 TaxID=2591461 RepID=UPI001FEFA59B|nr:hypothetical protein [Bradyrhizobium sp. USDA 3458]
MATSHQPIALRALGLAGADFMFLSERVEATNGSLDVTIDQGFPASFDLNVQASSKQNDFDILIVLNHDVGYTRCTRKKQACFCI